METAAPAVGSSAARQLLKAGSETPVTEPEDVEIDRDLRQAGRRTEAAPYPEALMAEQHDERRAKLLGTLFGLLLVRDAQYEIDRHSTLRERHP